MNKTLQNRILKEAYFILNTKKTIREVAEYFKVGKSTVHKDMKYRLKKISNTLYEEVYKVLQEHQKTRHLIGGQKTKEKYLKMRS